MILFPSYPRCGTHFLVENFLQKTGVVLNKTHVELVGDYDLVLTIVRNPRDSIVSRLAMELAYEANPKSIYDLILICKKEYISFFNYAKKHVDVIFKYEDLDNIDNIINYLCNKLNIEKISDSFVDNIHDRPGTRFLKTSKTSKHYNMCKEIMKDVDLTEEEKIYKEILNISISFDN
jgi:hypothetical protein